VCRDRVRSIFVPDANNYYATTGRVGLVVRHTRLVKIEFPYNYATIAPNTNTAVTCDGRTLNYEWRAPNLEIRELAAGRVLVLISEPNSPVRRNAKNDLFYRSAAIRSRFVRRPIVHGRAVRTRALLRSDTRGINNGLVVS